MKKFLSVFVSFLLIILTGGIVNAEPPLPEISLALSSDGILSWEAVSGADKYWVGVGESFRLASGNSFDLKECEGSKGTFLVEVDAYSSSDSMIARKEISANLTDSVFSIVTSHKVKYIITGEDQYVYYSAMFKDGERVPTVADPFHEDFTFDGWYEDLDSNTKFNFDSISAADVTLYGRMFNRSNKIYVDVPRVYPPVSDIKLSEAGVMTWKLPPDSGEMTIGINGRWIKGEENGSCNLEGSIDKDGTYIIELRFVDTTASVIYSSDITVIRKDGKYSIDEAENYKVNFISDMAVEKTISCRKGSYITIPDISREGYTLDGWYTDPELTVAFDPRTPVTGDTDLYCRFVPATDIGRFLYRIYENVLGRSADQEGVRFWSNELYNFRYTGADVAFSFIFSDEFTARGTSDSEFVSILYRTFFGREPEADGLKFWVSSLENGALDRHKVAEGFIYSQEWADTCARYKIRSGGSLRPSVLITPTSKTNSFVERMYTTCMQRESDDTGLEFWAGLLANFDQTGESVGAFFFLSDEMQGLGLSDSEFVTRLYKTFMDREPEEGGFGFWTGFLADGGSRSDVVYGFTRSEEFVNKCIEARILPYSD